VKIGDCCLEHPIQAGNIQLFKKLLRIFTYTTTSNNFNKKMKMYLVA